MPKRKVGAGGYPQSSNDSDVDATPQTTSKKPKPYQPPMVSMMKKPGAAPFLLPRLEIPTPSARIPQPVPPVASSSLRPKPVSKPAATTSHIPTPKDTPALPKDTSSWDMNYSDAEKESAASPIATLGQRNGVRATALPLGAATQPQDTTRTRSSAILARAVND